MVLLSFCSPNSVDFRGRPIRNLFKYVSNDFTARNDLLVIYPPYEEMMQLLLVLDIKLFPARRQRLTEVDQNADLQHVLKDADGRGSANAVA
ncbi:hypothetical protein [Paenibacillus sp. URB8-2]|uniref:hypothetical protein n=1 Tax=Paenibacillus sp. URB8-2 TaxID=2741301 RepID=UPI0015BF6575|nr:hypothetical protein [Paenibacillus sp. URB8-2]